MSLVRRRPLVDVVIIMATKEEVRRGEEQQFHIREEVREARLGQTSMALSPRQSAVHVLRQR